MDTIKIYLADSGDFASLVKNFPLYIGSYQNKLVNVYVPTRILAPDFISQLDGVTISEYVAGTAVKIGLSYTASNGLIKISKGRYLNYIKTLTYQNVEYALFERRLPKEFTMYAGQGENAPQLTINVVNIETDVEQGEEPVVLDTITSQICYLDVMPSTVLDNEEEIEPSELETINARLTAIDTTLAEKQNITDEALNTTSKTVVGGINELKATSDIHTQQIGENTEDIAENRNDIDYLYGHMAQAEEYVGQMTGTVLPSDNALTAFVVATTSPSRQPKNADVVIFILQIPGETDKNYKYLFADAGWGGYEIPPMELSSNGTAGLVKGTYSIGSENDTLVDISGGQILNIYVKDTAGTYRNIREYANTLNTTIESIISGNTSVGSAVKALQDGLGNNIVNTYLTQNAGATKQYVRDYSLPREFNDTYFIASTGYQGTIPTTPESGIQFSEISSAVGDLTLFQIEKTNIADFQLASKNSSHNTIYISTNRNCTVYFRLTTQAKKFGQEWVDLSIELSNWIALTNGDIQKLTFGSTFSALDDTILIMADNDLFRQKLEVITQESAETTFNIYSNETYPSSFGINTQAQVQVIAQGDLGEQPVYELSGEINENIVSFEFNSLTILNENVEAKFVLEYTTETELADDVELVLTLNEENIRLVTPYNINNGNATVKYLKQTATQHFSGVQSWAFKGFIQKNGSDFEIFVDIDNIEDYIEGIDYLKDPAKTYLVIKTPADNDTFTLLTGSSGSPNYTVEWGDGESETITTTDNLSHEYATAGMYLITISGSFENGIVFGSDANVNKDKIIEVYGGSNYSTSIGNYAFYNCTSLTTANFPNATSIGGGAFYGCTYLTTADIPKATNIGNYAFRDCTSLTTANFPQATSIGSSAFRDCTSLKELILGNVTLTSAGTRFENVKLTNLTIAQDATDTDIERIKQFYADNGGTFSNSYELKHGLQVEKTPTADLDVVRKVDLDTHTSNTSNPHTVTKSQVGLSNAYNPTAYGGVSYGGGNSETGVSFTDLNSLAYTGFYTCFGTTANVPSASYSWFIQHENSNVGNVSATQTATAYGADHIIYKRNKTANTWGAWENISPSLKADKVIGATAGNLAALDSVGNLVDSGKKASDFDVYVTTQAEFEALIASPTWLVAERVAFIGDGGTLEFTLSASVVIPQTVKKIEGFNNAIINFGSGSSFGYATKPTALEYTIKNIFTKRNATSGAVRGFINCINLVNCQTYARSNTPDVYGFYNCDYLKNCVADAFGYYFDVGSTKIGFGNCTYLENCRNVDPDGTFSNCLYYSPDIDAKNLSNADVTSWKNKLGNSKLVAEMTLASNANSMTISGLDLIADGGVYDVVCEYKMTASADIYLRVNNLSGNIYARNVIKWYSGSATVVGGGGMGANAFHLGSMWIYLGISKFSLTQKETTTVEQIFDTSGNDASHCYGRHGGGIVNPLGTVTSFTIFGGTFVAGARVKVYSRAK